MLRPLRQPAARRHGESPINLAAPFPLSPPGATRLLPPFPFRRRAAVVVAFSIFSSLCCRSESNCNSDSLGQMTLCDGGRWFFTIKMLSRQPNWFRDQVADWVQFSLFLGRDRPSKYPAKALAAQKGSFSFHLSPFQPFRRSVKIISRDFRRTQYRDGRGYSRTGPRGCPIAGVGVGYLGALPLDRRRCECAG